MRSFGRFGIRADRVPPGSATLGREYATAIAPSIPLAEYRGNIPRVAKNSPRRLACLKQGDGEAEIPIRHAFSIPLTSP